MKRYLTAFLAICILLTSFTGCAREKREEDAIFIDITQSPEKYVDYDGEFVCAIGYRIIEGPYADEDFGNGIEYALTECPLTIEIPIDATTNTVEDCIIFYAADKVDHIIPADGFPIKIWGTLSATERTGYYFITPWNIIDVDYRRLTYDEMLTVELRTFAKLADKGYIEVMNSAYRELQKHIRYKMYDIDEATLKEEIKLRDLEEIKQDIMSWDENYDGSAYIHLIEYINEVVGWVNYNTKNGEYEKNLLYDAELEKIEALYKEFRKSGIANASNVKIN